MHFDIDPELADLVQPVPETPATSGFVAMDDAFAASEFGLEEDETVFAKCSSADDAEIIVMNLPQRKVAHVSKRQLRACKTDVELRELDRQLYRSVGLNPADYGI